MKSVAGQLETYAIREYNNQAFAKSAMIAIVSSDGLQECLTSDEGKASIVNALKMAAGTGLSLNPQNGQAALVPFNKKVNNKWVKTAQYMVMKNGLIELALMSGKVEFITADTVREADDFTMSKTMNGDEYKFSPNRKARGEIDGFFAAVKMKDGTCHCKYMTQEEVTAHREEFSEKTKMPVQGYGEKTILKKLLNGVHISPDVDNAIGAENQRNEVDITPPPEKGTSPEDLNDKLKANAATTTDAEIIEPDQAGEDQQSMDLGQNKTQHDTPI
jgi:phage RecT family recombinase